MTDDLRDPGPIQRFAKANGLRTTTTAEGDTVIPAGPGRVRKGFSDAKRSHLWFDGTNFRLFILSKKREALRDSLRKLGGVLVGTTDEAVICILRKGDVIRITDPVPATRLRRRRSAPKDAQGAPKNPFGRKKAPEVVPDTLASFAALLAGGGDESQD